MYRHLVSALQSLSWVPSRHREEQLRDEAEVVKDILCALVHRTNHAKQPELYARLSRLHDSALRRCQRRRLAASVAFYRSLNYRPEQIPPDHHFYQELVVALST